MPCALTIRCGKPRRWRVWHVRCIKSWRDWRVEGRPHAGSNQHKVDSLRQLGQNSSHGLQQVLYATALVGKASMAPKHLHPNCQGGGGGGGNSQLTLRAVDSAQAEASDLVR